MILLIALRNLFRNKRSSFLLILLLAFITFIFFLGSSLIRQSIEGMRRTYIDNLTGDLVVQKQSDVSMNLFGSNTPIIDDFFKIPTLPAFEELKAVIADDPDINCSSAMVSGQALLDVNGIRAAVPMMGVDAESYFDLFPGIVIEEGRKILPGESGIMINSNRKEGIETQTGEPVEIGSSVLLTSAGDSGFKIRELTLTGIYYYTNPGPYMQEIVITDPQTVRALSSVLAVASEQVEVADDALELLDQDMDSLFSGDGFFAEASEEDESDAILSSLKDELKADDEAQTERAWQGGDWNFLLLRLEEGVSSSRVRNRLNAKLKTLGANTVGWQVAAGNSALMVMLIQVLFYGGIVIVGFAGVVTIVNIILISVFKRIRELGTLRAIGASDAYIMTMVFLENLIVAVLGGIIGIMIGIFLMRFINSQQWPITESLIAALLGSPVFYVNYSSQIAFQSIFLAVGLGVAASLFPGWKATRINPMEAVRRG